MKKAILVFFVLVVSLLLVEPLNGQAGVGLSNIFTSNTLNYKTSTNKIIMGYFLSPNLGSTEFDYHTIDFSKVTHIAHAFTYPDNEGNFETLENFLNSEFIDLCHDNNVFMLLSIGGRNESDTFAQVVADAAKRTSFIDAIVDTCIKYDYDGVHINWDSDLYNSNDFSDFIQYLSSSSRHHNLWVTIAVKPYPMGDGLVTIDWSTLIEDIDLIGIKTFNYHSNWSDVSGHNAPLYSSSQDSRIGYYSIDASFKHYSSEGVPSGKMLLGIPLGGWKFPVTSFYQSLTPEDNNNTTALSYSQIHVLDLANWTEHFDVESLVPYLVNENSIISYENENSIRSKINYLLDNNLAGASIWNLGQDYIASTGEQPLLTTLESVITTIDEAKDKNRVLIPDEFRLHQNYPNPFNPTTIISFHIGRTADIKVIVYSIRGEKVKTLVSDFVPPGSYSYSWDGTNDAGKKVASGVYVYSLKSGNILKTRKLLFLK